MTPILGIVASQNYPRAFSCDYLVVAGGGGGGAMYYAISSDTGAAGGGAGGLRFLAMRFPPVVEFLAFITCPPLIPASRQG